MKNYNRIIDVFSILILISVAYCSFWDVFLFVPNYYLFVFLYGFVFFYRNNKPIKLLILCLLIAISSIKHIVDYSTNLFQAFLSYSLLSTAAFIVGTTLAYWANTRSKKLYLYILTALSPVFFYLAAMMILKNYYFGIAVTGLSVYFLALFLFSEKWHLYQVASAFLPPISLFFLMLNLDAEPSVVYTINSTMVIAWFFALSAQATGKRHLFTALNAITSLCIFPLILVNAQNHTSLKQTFTDIPKSKFIYRSDTVSLDVFKGKILVLDFWHTRCGPCYKKFP